MRQFGLKTKFIIGTLGPIVLVGIVLIVSIRIALYRTFRTELSKRGVSIARHVAKQCTDLLLVNEIVNIQFLIEDSLKIESDVNYIYLKSERGKVILHTFCDGFPRELRDVNILKQGQTYSVQPLITPMGAIMDVAVPLMDGALGSLHIGISESVAKKRSDEIARWTIMIIVIALLLGAIAIYLLTNALSRSIFSIIKGIEAIGRGGNIENTIHSGGGGEITLLSDAFHRMAEKVVNDRKEMEEKIIRSEKLAAIGKVGGVIAHELRTPLCVMGELAYLIEKSFGDKAQDKKLEKYLNMLSHNVEMSNRIINNILAFSRVKIPHFEEAEINDVVDFALTAITKRVPGNIEIIRDFTEALPKVSIDREQIHLVFTNILINGVQSMLNGGRLTVSTRAENDSIDVIITDTGEGIADKDLPRIFDPLFSTKTTGTGLGLAVCVSIIKKNNGTIDVKSRLGAGTTFKITLPEVDRVLV